MKINNSISSIRHDNKTWLDHPSSISDDFNTDSLISKQ